MRQGPTSAAKTGGAPQLATHEQRVAFLGTLADLMGCNEVFGGEFPDGRRPDVLRTDSRLSVLFVGDAKHTESPGNLETQIRLQTYMRWLAAFVERGAGIGIFALCFGKEAHTYGWQSTISLLAREVGLEPSEQGVERFDHQLIVVWYVF